MKPLHRLRRQAGVGIVTAIFLLVVLAGLAVAIVGVYTHQQSSANTDLLGARAYQAARAGLEWGIFQQLRNGTCPGEGKATAFKLPGGTSLSDFTVAVTCRAIGAGDLTRWIISATACNMPATAPSATTEANICPPVNNAESVRRTLEVEL